MIFQAFLWCSWVWAMNTLQIRHEIVFGHHMLFYSTFRIGSILLRAVFTPLAVLNRTIILPNVEVLWPVMMPHGPCHRTLICGIVLRAIVIDPVARAFEIVGTMHSRFVDDSELRITNFWPQSKTDGWKTHPLTHLPRTVYSSGGEWSWGGDLRNYAGWHVQMPSIKFCHRTLICGIVLHTIVIDPVARAFEIVGTMHKSFVDTQLAMVIKFSSAMTLHLKWICNRLPNKYVPTRYRSSISRRSRSHIAATLNNIFWIGYLKKPLLWEVLAMQLYLKAQVLPDCLAMDAG